jgi:hypothetical protein
MRLEYPKVGLNAAGNRSPAVQPMVDYFNERFSGSDLKVNIITLNSATFCQEQVTDMLAFLWKLIATENKYYKKSQFKMAVFFFLLRQCNDLKP